MLELGGVIDEGAIGERYRLLAERRVLDDRGRRLWAAAEARSHGHGGSAPVERGLSVLESRVLRLLRRLGYSLQANQKTREGAQHPDRDAQFEQINRTVAAALAAGEPAISIDSKKRELAGDFKAVGREFEPTGRPVAVRSHDFKDKRSEEPTSELQSHR